MVDGSKACFVVGCQEPVVGRCECGRDYCARHASGGLCLRCMGQQVLRNTAERACETYLALAKTVAPRGLGWSLLVAVIVASVPAVLSIVMQNTVCLLASLGSPLIVTPLIALADRGRSQRQVEKMAASRPGFAEFYRAWRAHGDHEALLAALEQAQVAPADAAGA